MGMYNFHLHSMKKAKQLPRKAPGSNMPLLIWTTTLREIKFVDVTLYSAKPWAEHRPQLIPPSSQCCKKFPLVQQCMASARHLLVGDMFCNLITDSMQYSWNMIWEAWCSWANCSPIWRPSEPSAAPGSSKKYLRFQNRECCATTHQAQL